MRHLGLRAVALALLLALATPAAVQAASPDEVNRVASQLVCQCGCGAVLSNCIHEVCGVRDGMMATIGAKLDQGMTEKAIVADLVQSYGEVVLAAPTKRGFNLAGWITPFAAIAGGAVVIYLAVRAWLLWGRRAQEETTEPLADSPYLSRVDEELKRYEERMG